MVKLDLPIQDKILNQILTQNLNVSQTEDRIENYITLKKDNKLETSYQYDPQKIMSKLIKEISKLELKYNISLNKEEIEDMNDISLKITIPRYKEK